VPVHMFQLLVRLSCIWN